jgi:NAD(P)-dependent dehydrogenase (short-subunit alcohol dehydrogenase family)
MTEPKVALVTGATSGIGRATAIGLGKAGYRVAILGRREDELKRTAELAGARYAGPCDVSDPAAVHRYFSDLKAQLGRIDVVFNNAGMFAPQMTFGDVDIETWKRMVDVNLNGAFYVAREAFRAMRDQHPQGGRIINNGSISAYVPRPNSAPYTATKHAITGLTKSIALDGRAFDIACGQIDIGNAATELSNAIGAGILQANGTMMAEPRFDAAEVGRAVAYMAGLPLDTNVLFMTVMATNMPYIGRG